MWIFTRDGFLSIVEHNLNSNILIVRSRFKNHIEKIFGEVNVKEDEGTDYEFRAEIPREQVAEVMAHLIDDINYPNFKNELGSLKKIDSPYVRRCWAVYEVVQGNFEV
jgi:hypothetical protein